ncbi:formyltransferase family protein [Halorientalis marina]|uniref:formyltransferase family protein n=1 Tax=Halorientalis marina TaxID=2931976 RepID=UPI001FF68424|nr:formyltransferase family protein [Halorientalis marina]
MGDDVFQVGLLLGMDEVPEWFATGIERLVENTNAEISIIMVATPTSKDETSESGKTGPLSLINSVKNSLFGSSRQPPRPLDELDCVKDTKQEQCDIIPQEGLGIELPEKVVQQFEEIDVGIHMGVGILKGEILTAPEYGILGFHHGDIRQYRGSSAGFWEFLHGEEEMGITLQRLQPELDAGEIVVFESVDISDACTLGEIRSRYRTISEKMLEKGILLLQDEDFSAKRPDSLGKVYKEEERQRWKVTALYLYKEMKGRTRQRLLK